MPGGILLISIIGLVLIIIAIFVACLYSWEAKIKVNNNGSYKSDTSLQSAHEKFNITSWAALIVLIILILELIVFIFFSEVLIFILKPLIIGTLVICFIVLCIFDYLMFSGIHDMKSSPNFNTTENKDDATSLRDARIGAWAVFISIMIVLGTVVILLLGVFTKKKAEKKKKAEESKEESHTEEEEPATEEVQ